MASACQEEEGAGNDGDEEDEPVCRFSERMNGKKELWYGVMLLNKRSGNSLTSTRRRRLSVIQKPLTLILLTLVLVRCEKNFIQLARTSAQDEQNMTTTKQQQQQQVQTTTTRSSELSFEYLNLKSIPSEHLCQLIQKTTSEQISTTELSNINLVSFANNQVHTIQANAFACIGRRLRLINLRNNKIQTIAKDAFHALDQLQVLILDANRLKQVPAHAVNHLTQLRHLNLANNQIEQLNDNDDEGTRLNGTSLISLNLRGNPIAFANEQRAFKGLSGLRTLILSQIELQSSGLSQFVGLTELQFVHLNQVAKRAIIIDENFCASSRKLASLSLQLNHLEQVPRLLHCKSLLSLDLSYNKIFGSLEANFSELPNLIDLYLSHNLIEHIGERAFVGLNRLQLLELNNNRLKSIHKLAFLPVRSSLHELNLSNNKQLAQSLNQLLGLDQLIAFSAFGNELVRELPRFEHAKRLALTFAYHCCDYYNPSVVGDDKNNNSNTQLSNNDQQGLVVRLYDFVAEQFKWRTSGVASNMWTQRWWNGVENNSNEFKAQDDDDEPEVSGQNKVEGREEAQNLTREMIFWPQQQHHEMPNNLSSSSSQQLRYDGATFKLNTNERKLHERHERGVQFDSRAQPEVSRANNSSSSSSGNLILAFSLIDEQLVERLAQIRKRKRLDTNENDDYEDLVHKIGHQDDTRRPLFKKLGLQLDHQRNASNDDYITSEQHIDFVARKMSALFLSTPDSSSRRTRRDAGDRVVTECAPKPNAFQPCRDLFDAWWLRASIWFVFVLAFVGNVLVIVVLASVRPSSSTSALTSIMWFNAARSKRHIDVPRFLVLNLAIADLLMACYLGLLAFVDAQTLGDFKSHAIKWQHSAGCQLAGFLAVLSSELSVFILAIITLERNYAITNAVHLNRRLSLQKAIVIMFFGYMYALLMAILPLNGINNYHKFSICLPLEFETTTTTATQQKQTTSFLTHSKQPQSSAIGIRNNSASSSLYLITLIGINSISFILLLSCYLRMYCAIRGSQAWNANDLRIAKRMSILVLTDFLCWSPIIFTATLRLFGYSLVGPQGLKIFVIFILPLNSVANPFLYAITTKKFKRDLDVLKRRLKLTRVQQNARIAANLLLKCSCKHQHNATTNQTNDDDNNNKVADNFDLCKHHANKHRHAIQVAMATSRGRKAPPVHKQSCASHMNVIVGNKQKYYKRNNNLMSGKSKVPTIIANNTNNQVTMNKTTCASCRHKQIASSAHSMEQAHQLDDDASTMPRIVLETVEPVLDAALSPFRLLVGSVQQHNCSAQQCNSGGTRALLLETPASQHLARSSDIVLLNCGTSHTPTHVVGSYLRPNSAETSGGGGGGGRSTSDDATKQQRYTCALHQQERPGLVEHVSCQTIVCRDNEQQTQNDANANRCVSACAFNWPTETDEKHKVNDSRTLLQTNATANDKTLAACSCSCDAIQKISKRSSQAATNATRPDAIRHRSDKSMMNLSTGGARTSSSFNRLVFSPIARAWSTLQLSLQSGLASTSSNLRCQSTAANRALNPIATNNQLDRQPSATATVCRRASHSSNASVNSHSSSTQQELLLQEQSLIIDDILQMSSPMKRRLLKERRMSRSCDMMTGNEAIRSKQQHDGNNSSSTSNNNEFSFVTTSGTTNSTLYDQNDDQRILLATINQLAERRVSSKRSSRLAARGGNLAIKKRPNCTRCRSWSPALLDKLEDCMHQIRSRIPVFGADPSVRRRARQDVACFETMEERPSCSSEAGDQLNSNAIMNNNAERQTEVMSGLDNDGSSHDDDDDGEHSFDSDDDDNFDEIADIDEWTRNLQRRTNKRPRLHQQLSGTSDTLTVGTTLTSVSVESATNVAPAIASSLDRNDESQRENSECCALAHEE